MKACASLVYDLTCTLKIKISEALIYIKVNIELRARSYLSELENAFFKLLENLLCFKIKSKDIRSELNYLEDILTRKLSKE